MSRIGKQFVSIPEGVTAVLEGQKLSIFSSKGIFSRIVPSLVRCTLGCNLEDEKDGNQKLFLEKVQKTKFSQALYGLSRTLIASMVTGMSVGFEKKLQITGVGYRVQLDGNDLVLNMGYSHPVKMIVPPNLSVEVESPTRVIISGIQKDMVGRFAAKIRAVRPPEPYKGKGVAYEEETIRRKTGKTAK